MTTETFTTTDLNQRLGVYVTAGLLKKLGFVPYIETKVGIYWRESDYSSICASLASYIRSRGNL